MENNRYFFAVDLGATSGRTIIGTLTEGKIQLEELTRFENNLIETGGHFYWDIFARANERSCMRGVLWFGRGLFILERRSCFDFERCSS